MKKFMDIVNEISTKLEVTESKFKGAAKEDILENAAFFDTAEEVFEHIYISDQVKRNAKVIKQMASISSETLKEFNGSVQEYLLHLHQEVVVLDDGQYIFMTGKPKVAA